MPASSNLIPQNISKNCLFVCLLVCLFVCTPDVLLGILHIVVLPV